ncbi:MAG: C1 family peptidase [Erysipelotrichaceae bacterium]
MSKTIELNKISTMREAFLIDSEKCLRMNAVTANGIDAVAANYHAPLLNPNTFSLELPSGNVVSQLQSGRCWLFAATNVLRMQTITKFHLKEDFELSQTYLYFWDKLEKANYMLENILSTLNEEQGSRMLDWILQAPFNDGGQWDMMVGIIQKYGIVPKSIMPDTAVSGSSRRLNSLLTTKGREFAKTLRDAYQAGSSMDELSTMKEGMLEDIFTILCISLGTPPTEFTFEIRTKDGEYIQDTGCTPMSFYDKYVGLDLNDYVSLIHSPTSDKPFYRAFTVDKLGSVVEGVKVNYLNLPIDELKEATLKQLQSKEPVWFGSDVGKSSHRDTGLMDLKHYDYDTLFSTSFNLDKSARLDYCESLMTHAMVITGANITDTGVNRWKVENSWSDSAGIKGWFRMTDDWFSEFVYQVVINKKFLNEKQLAALTTEPIVLNPWDPMGSLANK